VQRHEREMKQKLEEQEESALNIAETYQSLQQEVEIKTRKLKKVSKLFHAAVGSHNHQTFYSTVLNIKYIKYT